MGDKRGAREALRVTNTAMVARSVDAKPKDKVRTSLVETKIVSRLTRLSFHRAQTHLEYPTSPLVSRVSKSKYERLFCGCWKVFGVICDAGASWGDCPF